MARESKYVWVSLDVVRAGATTGYRGRMTWADFEAIISGNYPAPFVRLEEVHWVDQSQGRSKVTAFGRSGEWEWHVGSLYLRPDAIATFAPMTDEYTEAFQQGLESSE